NFLDGKVARRNGSGVEVTLDGGDTVILPIASPESAAMVEGAPLCVGIRPEHVQLADSGLPVAVALTEQLGGNTVLYGALRSQQPLVIQVVGQSEIARGDTVHVRLPPQCCHGFGADGLSLAATHSLG
ncbi:MAG: TOBE domain-containing protein, partial [Betaproteobacteria bacterium]